MVQDWPLHGRARQLRTISAALSGAFGEPGGGAILIGVPGVGKSRLAREVSAAAERSGFHVRWITGTASAKGIALAPFTPFLSGREPTLPNALAGLLDSTGGDGQPIVVVVDDAHLLDDASAVIVGQLAGRLGVSMLLTVRTGARLPDSVRALWKDSSLRTHRIQPLDEGTTTSLVSHVLGGPLTPAAGHKLWTWSGGNPLYLQGLVDAGVSHGHLKSVGDQFEWTGPADLSDDVMEAIAFRMSRVSPAALTAIDFLALGEPLKLVTLERLVEVNALEELEAATMIVVEQMPTPVIRLAHPLYGEARRRQLGRLKSRRLRGELARVLADEPEQDESLVLRRGLLSLQSDQPPDPQLLTRAAQVAAAAVDLSAAARLSQAAVAASGLKGGAAARFVLANIRGLQGDVAVARRLLDEVTRGTTDADFLARVAVTQVATLVWPGRDVSAAERVIEQTRSKLSSSGLTAEVAAMSAVVDTANGQWHRALSSADRARVGTELDVLARVLLAFGRVISFGCTGRLEEMEAAAHEGYDAAAEEPTGALVTFGLCHLHMVGLQRMGRLQHVRAIAERRYDALSMLPGLTTVYGLGLLGHAALARGQVRTARRCLEQVRDVLPRDEPSGFGFMSWLNLAQARALDGDYQSAEAALVLLKQEQHPAFRFAAPEVSLAGAWVAAARGSATVAIAQCQEAARLARRLGIPSAEVLAWHTAAVFGDRGAAAALSELGDEVEGPRLAIARRHAQAVQESDGQSLTRSARDLEACGDLLFAANASAQAALVHRARGRNGQASLAAANADRLRSSCENARTPVLLAAATRLPLTARQLEVVDLAARGRTNQEIAAGLNVSVRTVEGHLYRAMALVGARRRGQLRRVLEDAGYIQPVIE